jgi:hypothetical protein
MRRKSLKFRQQDLRSPTLARGFSPPSTASLFCDIFDNLNLGERIHLPQVSAADLEGKHEVKADQRVDQFLRLRDAIEERASRRFFERPVHAEGPVVLRSNDFFK